MNEVTLRVKFSDGTSWDIPAKMIAHQRAAYYAERDSKRGDGTYDDVYRREWDYTISSDEELLDWAVNNADWRDFANHAIPVSKDLPKADYDKEWSNATMNVKRPTADGSKS